MKIHRWGTLATVVALVALSACGGDDSTADAPAADTTPAATDGTAATDSTPPDTAAATDTAAPSSDGGGTDGESSDVTGTIRVGTYLYPPGLDPHTATGGQPVIQYLQPVYDSLLLRNADFTFSPMVATEWEYTDDTNTTLQMKIRDDIVFSDGTALDAEAVKLNLERALEKQGDFARYLGGLESVEVVDPTTVILHLGAPSPTLELGLSGPAGMLVSPAAFDNADLDINPVGSGPYEFDAGFFVDGSSWGYDARDDYWAPELVGPSRLELTLITDPEARFNALTSGQIDIALGSVDQIDAARGAGLNITEFDVDWQGLMLMDRSGEMTPALGDVRVRQALNYAIDRQTMVDAVLGGRGTPTDQIFPASSYGYVAELEGSYNYDPDHARALLADAGYADGFTLRTPSVAPLSTFVEAIGGYLADIGVTLEIDTLDTGFVAAVISGDYDAPVMSFGMEHPDADAQILLTPDATFNPFHTDDPEITRLLDEAAALPTDEATERYQEIGRIVHDDAWFLPIYRPTLVYFTNPDVSNFEVYALQAAPAIYGWKIDG